MSIAHLVLSTSRRVLAAMTVAGALSCVAASPVEAREPRPHVETRPFKAAADLSAHLSKAEVITYSMSSVRGRTVPATALVLTPKMQMPKGGWPVVLWAHGTTGTAWRCAPSVMGLDRETTALLSTLLDAGYLIVAPDYEGLGIESSAFHPYLDARSAANSISAALRAVKRGNWNISRRWVVVGWSQGGHAALAAAAHSRVPGIQLRGAVAIAPAPRLEDVLGDLFSMIDNSSTKDPEKAGLLTAELNAYAALLTSSARHLLPSLAGEQPFGNESRAVAASAKASCITDLTEAFGTSIKTYAGEGKSVASYPGFTRDYATMPLIARYMRRTRLPDRRLDKPVAIFKGLKDVTIPMPATIRLVDAMKARGTAVTYRTYLDDDHFTVVIRARDDIRNAVDAMMK